MHGDHWEIARKTLLGRRCVWIRDARKISEMILTPQGGTNPINPGDNICEKLCALLLSEPKTQLSELAVCRLQAERNISPELANNIIDLKRDGGGYSNLVRKLLHDKSANEKLIRKLVLAELNEICGKDATFLRIEARHDEDEKYEICLEEEHKGLVHLSDSGSGLKTILLVLLNTLVIPKLNPAFGVHRYLFAFEELENNLHPALLRRLFDFLVKFQSRTQTRIVLTTHSNVAIDYFSAIDSAQIVHVKHNGQHSSVQRIETHFDRAGLIAELGAKPADLLQANGIIWLEGPSDRFYINKFISLLSDGELVEGKDYQCAYYGGSNLANTEFVDSSEENEDLTNLLRLNSNLALICDSDQTSSDTPLKKRVERTKAEVEKQGGFVWVSEAKEIECYIPGRIWQQVYQLKSCPPDPTKGSIFPSSPKDTNYIFQHCNKSSFHKVDVAKRVCQYLSIGDLDRFDLVERINELIEVIRRWND